MLPARGCSGLVVVNLYLSMSVDDIVFRGELVLDLVLALDIVLVLVMPDGGQEGDGDRGPHREGAPGG